MSRIVRWCLENKSVVILATILLVGSGAYGTTRLNQELLPDISFPIIVVSTPVPGAGPDVVDEQVTQQVESAVSGVGEIESIESTSSQGFSVVLVEFDLDADTDEAEAELQTALDGVELPPQVGEPEIQSQSADQFPILTLSLAAEDGDLAGLTRYAEDEVVPDIEQVDGVASADLIGGAETRVEVELSPDKLKEQKISTDAVVGAIGGANVDAPVGSVPVSGSDTPVRATSELSDPQALEDLPVGVSGGAPTGAPTGAVPAGAPAGAPFGAPTGAPSGAGAPPSAGAVPGGASAAAAAPSSAAPAAAEVPEPVTLGQVAEVREVPSDLAGISRTNGEPSLGLNIVKESDANTVDVAAEIEGVLDDAREELGEDQVVVVVNSATDVEESVNGLVEEALIGAVLAILVIFAFLRNLRATLVTAVSLPTSVLAALLFSWADNLTLNIITLAGLTIAVGRVVDDAIVVLENSYRYVQRGYEPEEAALKGTTEVASAITSSTLTTTAVFLPLALVGGIVSKFFVPLSLTVALALVASLIVAVTIVPVLFSLLVRRRTPEENAADTNEEHRDEYPEDGEGEYGSRRDRRAATGGGGIARFLVGALVFLAVSAVLFVVAAKAGLLDGLPGVPPALVDAASGLGLASPVVLVAALVVGALLLAGVVLALVRASRGRGARPAGGEEDGLLVRLYTPMLLWALRHRLATLLLAFLALVGGLATVPFLPVSFFPSSEERLLQAEVELDPGTGLEQTSERLRPFEDFLAGEAAVQSYQVSIGGEDTLSPDSPVRPNNRGQAFITVKEGRDVERELDRIDKEGDDLYGEGFQVQVISNGPPQGGLEAIVTGGTEEQRAEAAGRISDEFRTLGDVNNVRSDLSGGNPEVTVEVDPEEAATAGLSPGGVSATLGSLVGETELTSIGETPVVATVPESAVDSIEDVEALPVGTGTTVGEVAEVREIRSPTAVSRVEGERAVTVTANITSADTQSVSAEAKAAVAEIDLPGGVSARVGGESEDIEEGFRNLFLSIIVALALVFLLLVVFFGSILIPLVILLAVPLTTVGVFGGLLITGTAISLPSLLGILLLIGIVVSNAILLVDFAVKAQRTDPEGYEAADEAVVAAGRARLRPILMTAFATVFALLPLGLGLSGGGNGLISSSLAITVIGGLTTSTFLTLLVVPVGYSLLKGGRRRKKG